MPLKSVAVGRGFLTSAGMGVGVGTGVGVGVGVGVGGGGGGGGLGHAVRSTKAADATKSSLGFFARLLIPAQVWAMNAE